MKIREIITEDHYAAGDDLSLDDTFNPELAGYNSKQRATYEKDSPGSTPVVKKIKYDQKKFTTKPQKDEVQQSPGYRGREYSKKRAGIKHDKKVEPVNYGFQQTLPEIDFNPDTIK